MNLKELTSGNLFNPLPNYPTELRAAKIAHAPVRKVPLDKRGRKLALSNVLRYVPEKYQLILAKEFSKELEDYGHIYAFRFMPNYFLKAPPLKDIPGRTAQGRAIILMILNNLDPDVAQFPQELVTYGGNGQVFSNWIQFRLTLHYLAEMNDEQTISMYSGHPHGIFPSNKSAPRMVITNGMMIPNYSNNYDKHFALNVTMYGQMTAGSYCYIGPQGIVHGTTITIKNAGRKYLGTDNLSGIIFVTSGLGGMSGAQAKASVIAGCVGVIAEISEAALIKRYKQGWLSEYTNDLDDIIIKICKHKEIGKGISIGYLGNVVDLWERLEKEDINVNLGSDQTSLHNPYNGGYYPVGISFDEANQMMCENPEKFKLFVKQSLLRHISAIEKLTKRGMRFWDYGNAFLLECSRAGANLCAVDAIDEKCFKYPSYIQDIMGDIFSMGFGPFRWICCSGDPNDLKETDQIAYEVLKKLGEKQVSKEVQQQYKDNCEWIQKAEEHKLVVGSQARILYSDLKGRIELAKAFNDAVKNGRIKESIVISRDHHDVSGTDSPFRETSNISDGSAFTADMAVQNVIGDALRGATWVSIHNGGGVGWGDVINGGFGMFLDGSKEAGEKAETMLMWDVANGISRRCWSGSSLAKSAIKKAMEDIPALLVTVPHTIRIEALENLS